MALSVDVDRFDDAYLRRTVLPTLKHEGKPVTVEQLRLMCFDHRNRGFDVFPPCDNTDARGYCQGHEDEDEDEPLRCDGCNAILPPWPDDEPCPEFAPAVCDSCMAEESIHNQILVHGGY